MGVHLSWDKLTKEDKNKQITGYDIGSGDVGYLRASIGTGDVGYLRASIGMVRENYVLRLVFPERFWNNNEDDGLPYDFSEDNFVLLEKIGAQYLLSVMTGSEINGLTEEQNHMAKKGVEKQAMFGAAIIQMLQKIGFDRKKIAVGTTRSLRWAVLWLNSLFEFFALGMEKQEKGLNPKVYISW